MRKKILILSISALLIYLTISIYQKITYSPKRQFLESIKYLSSTNLKNINIEDMKYTSDINIKLKENISKFIKLNENLKELIKNLENFNTNITFQKEKDNYELEIKNNEKTKKLVIYDSNIYIINDEVKNIGNIAKILDCKNEITKSIVNNLSYKYFETKEIRIEDEKINKTTLNLNQDNIKELINNIYNDIKEDISINIEEITKNIPQNLEIKINTYTKDNKNIKTELEINNIPKLNKILIEIQNNLINIKINERNIRINLNENIEVFLNDTQIMTIRQKKEDDIYKITIEQGVGLMNDIILKKNKEDEFIKNKIEINSNFLEMNLLNINIEESGTISKEVKINNPIDNQLHN